MQNLAGSTLQSRNSVRLCPSAVPDVNKALIRPGWAAAGCSECSQAELGTKFLKKIRKKWSEACLKQLLQQMSQFSCFAESRFTEARLAELGQQREVCVRLGAPGMLVFPSCHPGQAADPVPGHGVSSAPHSVPCLWAPSPSACRDVQAVATAADAGKGSQHGQFPLEMRQKVPLCCAFGLLGTLSPQCHGLGFRDVTVKAFGLQGNNPFLAAVFISQADGRVSAVSLTTPQLIPASPCPH